MVLLLLLPQKPTLSNETYIAILTKNDYNENKLCTLDTYRLILKIKKIMHQTKALESFVNSSIDTELNI